MEVRRGLAVGLYKKKTQKLAVHAGGCGHNGGEKRNVLIVSILLPKAIDLALRSNMQRCPVGVVSAHFARGGRYIHKVANVLLMCC